MLYAKVVVGLPVEGPFDYIVPKNLLHKVKIGARVKVSFGTRGITGFVVGLAKKSAIKNLKYILEAIDEVPLLDRGMLLLTREVSHYYCCSWGEAIETALPEALRKGKGIPRIETSNHSQRNGDSHITVIQDLDGHCRWDIYIKSIKETLEKKRSAIFLLPDTDAVSIARQKIIDILGIAPIILQSRHPRHLSEWIKAKEGGVNIVLGTRSAIFAPLNNLGLIIIDEDGSATYKQEQVPHYHARQVAFMRARIDQADQIFAGRSCSLEVFRLSSDAKVEYKLIMRERPFPEIEIIDTRNLPFQERRKNVILLKKMQDEIASCLDAKGKVLLFLNRKGFATFVTCNNCGRVLKCKRCNINLVYHYDNKLLSCHYCNFKMEAPNICPECNSGYIRYLGLGTEKIESELSRIFPQAKIIRVDNKSKQDINNADIFIATQAIIKRGINFDFIGILSIDNSLNRIDFRAAEKVFDLLLGLLGLTDKKIMIQTALPRHHCFQALVKRDINLFYAEELKQRNQLGFPPYRHLGLVKLRGKVESQVKMAGSKLFDRLAKYATKAVKAISVNPGQPAKLRGNFYWQILLKSRNAKKMSEFLKMHLKSFAHSGIIVTVDIDP